MRKWNELGLRNQLLIIIILIQLFIIGVMFYYFSYNQRSFYINQLKTTLRNEAMLILANDSINLSQASPSQMDHWSEKWGKIIKTRITVVDKEGQVLADSRYEPDQMDNHRNRPEIKKVVNGADTGSSIRYSKTLGLDMLYLAVPVVNEGEFFGVIRLAKSLKVINEVISSNLKKYFIFFLGLMGIGIFLIWRFTSNLINPLQKMTGMAAEIADGNYQQRIIMEKQNKEIDEMAQKFNFMANQLEKKINEISAEKNKARAILSSMVDGLIATDENRNIILINPAARSMLDLEKGMKRKKRALITVVRNHRIDSFLEESLSENKTLSREIVLQRKEEMILRCHFAPITTNENQLLGGVIVMTDITELRRLEQIRKEFVANVSHELKTPLTSIIGYVDTLLESENIDAETSDRFLQIIKDEADRLSFLIQDLLNLSRVEQKHPDLKPGLIQDVVKKTVSRLDDKAKNNDIILKTKIKPNIPPVYMIKEQIEQVMTNLVDNSIKYTPSGGKVIIRITPERDRVLIEVEDNGIGIPSEDQARIFERFYRVDKARSRALGGTGIGLSIVKHIVQNHESKIQLDSTPGEGSCFWFYLKAATREG